MERDFDLVIVGGGPAGLTAGLYAARAGLRSLLCEAQAVTGGRAVLTESIENYPGFPQGISGWELMDRFAAQAKRFGLKITHQRVDKVEVDGASKIVRTPQDGWACAALIVATGCRSRELGVPGEKEFIGRGVSYCATCDGPFFRGKRVAVVGGGEAAVEEALFLAGLAGEVILIHRRDTLRASRTAQDRAFAHDRISFLWNRQVTAIEGRDKVQWVRLRDVRTGKEEVEDVDALFIYIGAVPNTEFLLGLVDSDEEGYLKTNDMLETSVPGIFAAGDVRSKALRQVSTAVGDGALAAVSAQRYISAAASG